MDELIRLLSCYGDVKCTFEVGDLHNVSFTIGRI